MHFTLRITTQQTLQQRKLSSKIAFIQKILLTISKDTTCMALRLLLLFTTWHSTSILENPFKKNGVTFLSTRIFLSLMDHPIKSLTGYTMDYKWDVPIFEEQFLKLFNPCITYSVTSTSRTDKQKQGKPRSSMHHLLRRNINPIFSPPSHFNQTKKNLNYTECDKLIHVSFKLIQIK